MRMRYQARSPFARASSVNYDARMLGNGGYGFLSDFQPVLDGQGGCYARVKVRALEVLQSIDIIEEMIAKIPAGDIAVDVKGSPAAGARPPTWWSSLAAIATTMRAATVEVPRPHAHAHADVAEPGRHGHGAGCDLADVNMIVLTIDPCISCTER